MPEQLGSRENLRIEQSRCLPNRYSESKCRRCVDICPHQAINLDEQLDVDPQRCTGCLLCTTVCPSGALEINHDFNLFYSALAKSEQPVPGCCRTSGNADAALSCLGGLSEEHLIVLSILLEKPLVLCLSICKSCPNNTIISILKKRLQSLVRLNIFNDMPVPTISENSAELPVQHDQLNRRSFFSSFRNMLFQSITTVVSTANDTAERQSEYAEKRLPQRRLLLNDALKKLSQEKREPISLHFTCNLTFLSNCSRCQGCRAICPSGALTTVNRETVPVFNQENCTGCGLCVEFCLEQAVCIEHPAGWMTI